MTYPISFWERDALLKPYDVIVIGGGIVGLCCAIFAARRHPEKRILILERGWFPAGATTRNAGFACFGSIGELLDDLSHEDEKAVRQRFEKRFLGLQKLHQLTAGLDIGYEASGNFEVFDSPEALAPALEQISRFNTWAESVSGEKNVFSHLEINGKPAIGNRLEGVLHSGKLALNLQNLAVSLGIELRFNATVSETGDGFVWVNGLRLQSEKILVATNGLTAKLLPEIGIAPARGLVLVSHPIENFPWKGGFHYNKGYIYFRHVGNRLLLGGARDLDKPGEETFDFGTNPVIQQHLHAFADTFLGLKGKWKTDVEWSGIMGFPRTKTPVVKKISPQTIVAAGLGGIGVAVGTLVAEEAVNLLFQ